MDLKENRIILFTLILEIFVLIIFIWIAYFASHNPIQNISDFARTSVSVSSIFFGFFTMSITRLLEEHRKAKLELSNLAKEMITLLKIVRDDPQLSKKRITCRSKVWIFGYDGCGRTDNAPAVIINAYNYFIRTIRYRISLSKKMLLMSSLIGAIVLLSPLSVNFVSYYITINSDVIGTLNLLTIIFGSILIIVGWLGADKMIENEVDVIFNIRHTILSELYSEDYSIGFSNYGN